MLARLNGNQRSAEILRSIDQSENSVPHRLPYRVLFIDDDDQTCRLLRDILLIREDISIVGRTSDGKEAVALAIRHQPDVILMDVNLPSLDVVEATYSIKQACARTVIIGLTEDFMPMIYSAMRTAGASSFVRKGEVLSIHETILCAVSHSVDDLSIYNGTRHPVLQCAYCGGAFSDYRFEAGLVSHSTCGNCASYLRKRNQLTRAHARAAVFSCLNEAGLNWRQFMKSWLKVCLGYCLRRQRGDAKILKQHMHA